jgi:hypothetical protein
MYTDGGMEDLQRIVDALADKLGRSVAIDDPEMKLRSYSAHHGHVDKVRLASILTRAVSPEVAAWAYSHKIKRASEPVRVGRNDELDYDPRLCVPIRRDNELLGFLWLIDADFSLTGEDIEAAVAAAGAAGDVMHEDRLRDDLRRGRERELLRDLLSDSEDVRQGAAESLAESDILVAAKAYAVFVVRTRAAEDHDPDALEGAVNAGLDDLRARHSRRHLLYLARPDHWLVVAATGERSIRVAPMALAQETHGVVSRALGRVGGGTVLVGVGDSQSAATGVRDAYRQARYAVQVAEVVSSFGPVVAWEQLGIYRMLIKFPVEELSREAMPAGLMTLLARRDGPTMLSTLETFLDLGTSMGATAEALNVHRVSLYARLRRIEEIAGVDLRDGQERLALHLGLKLARLAGIYSGAIPRVGHPVARDLSA